MLSPLSSVTVRTAPPLMVNMQGAHPEVIMAAVLLSMTHPAVRLLSMNPHDPPEVLMVAKAAQILACELSSTSGPHMVRVQVGPPKQVPSHVELLAQPPFADPSQFLLWMP